ncbi:unnamed protein product [Cuscuta epithymum]|uniref:Uncharacterized protein n=1 Tax=Cuscuta epithymum TaxID=186058 RepID=A0AAV0E0F6_9ASTE|nr:unnamed protein product [Cuscuta epithymum]
MVYARSITSLRRQYIYKLKRWLIIYYSKLFALMCTLYFASLRGSANGVGLGRAMASAVGSGGSRVCLRVTCQSAASSLVGVCCNSYYLQVIVVGYTGDDDSLGHRGHWV